MAYSETGGGSSPHDQGPTMPKEGLGAEKNARIADYLTEGNSDSLLDMITQEEDHEKACEVILESMSLFHHGSRADSVDLILKAALGDLDRHGDALKELVLYTWRNNLKGERFWKHPDKDETLFLDDDGELISLEAEVATHDYGDVKGMNYLRTVDKYTVLTGPNKGKVFDASYEAGQKNTPDYRPLKGPAMKSE